jgi:hypothetical protein
MSSDRDNLKELNAQINLKLAEGKLEEAERLSVSLIENAMGFDSRQNGPKEILSGMISKFMATVAPAGQGQAALTSDQIEAIKENAVNDEHLRLLGIFHYVNAGITALCTSAFLLYIGMGALMVLSPGAFASSGSSSGSMGYIFMIVGALALLIGYGYSALNVLAGQFLKRRVRHKFCLAIAGMNCLNMPIGLILGILTIVVLNKEKVKAKFRKAYATVS